MACRNAIAGAVFTIAIPGIMFVAGELLGVRQYGHGSVMEAFRTAFVWFGMLAISAIGFVWSWWMFLRLEAVEGRGEDISLPQWRQSTSSVSAASYVRVRRHPMWLLVKKEIRLQQLAIAIAALHALTLIIATWLTPLASNSRSWMLLSSATIMYAGIISLLIGCSASAAERDLGTLEWQLLQPIAASKQWTVKVAVVFAMSLVLAVAVPMTILHLAPLANVPPTLTQVQPEWSMLVALLLLTSGSVYVSSLCSSAVSALVMSLPVMIAAFAFFRTTVTRIGTSIFSASLRWGMEVLPAGSNAVDYPRLVNIVNLLVLFLAFSFIALVLRLALANHQSADRALRRISMHVIILAAFAIGARIVLSTAMGLIVALQRLQLPAHYR
jgi:hypothetical protein